MSDSQGNKIKTSIALNAYLRDRAKKLVEEKQFASLSDVISTALAEFIGRMDEKENLQKEESQIKFSELFEAYLQTEEGQKALKIIKNPTKADSNTKFSSTNESETVEPSSQKLSGVHL